MSEGQYDVFDKMITKIKSRNAKKIAQDYFDDWERDASVDQLTLMVKLEEVSLIAHKWSKRNFDQKMYLYELGRMRETVFQKLKKIKQHSGDILDKSRFGTLSEDAPAWGYALKKEQPLIDIDNSIAENVLLSEFIQEYVNFAKFTLMKSCSSIVELKKVEALT